MKKKNKKEIKKKNNKSYKNNKFVDSKTKTIIIILIIFFFIILSLLTINYIYRTYYIAPIPVINSIDVNEENIMTINFSIEEYKKKKDIYCIYKNNEEEPKIDDKDWKLTKNNKCDILIEDNSYFVYLKNADNIITFVSGPEKYYKVTKLESNKNKIYLALKTSFTPTLIIETIGNASKEVTWTSSDDSIATVDLNGKITAIKKGNATITASVMDQKIDIEVVSTNLIVARPKKYNNKKSYLPCNKYNKEENDLLDEILKDRINDAGYKTRAGAVEAARFLALEFPYKIRYFSENGRLATNKVDGEGRYYHVGLYLDESRFSKISKSLAGPKTWGCSMYSRPSKGKRSNGLDCSGFVSWTMLNGGFDVGDIGAGLASHLDLTDYGERIKFNASVVKSGKVKVGDLLSSGGVNGGHIAIIVGEDSNYYYVAESLWTPPNVAVVIIPYSKKTIFNRYYYVMLMDKYYKEDGNLTQLWY